MSAPSTSQDSGATDHPFRAGYLIAAGVAVAAIGIQGIQGLGDILQWHRAAALPTCLFDWLTGHLTHWSWDHLWWDVVAFLALSFAAIRLLPGRYLFCLALSVALIPLEIALNQPHLDTYRGLSGIDSALFGLILVGLWRTPSRNSPLSWNRVLAVAGAAAFLFKVSHELTTGKTLFVTAQSGPFVPAVSAHLTGLLSGLVAGGLRNGHVARVRPRGETAEPADEVNAPAGKVRRA